MQEVSGKHNPVLFIFFKVNNFFIIVTIIILTFFSQNYARITFYYFSFNSLFLTNPLIKKHTLYILIYICICDANFFSLNSC